MTPRAAVAYDARLVPASLAGWVATAVATTWSARAGFVLAVTTAAVALLAATRRGWAVCAAALGATAGAASAAIHVHSITSGPLVDLARRHSFVTADATVVRDPVAHTSGQGWSFLTIDATATSVRGRPIRTPVLVLANGDGWLHLLPGQRVHFTATARLPRPGDSIAAVLAARGPPALIDRPPLWQRAAGRVREALRAATSSLPPDERGLVPGLVIGDVTQMPDSLTRAFRVTGLTHLILSVRHGKSSGHLHAHLVGRARRGARRAATARGLREGRA